MKRKATPAAKHGVHYLDERLQVSPICVHLAGVGGTGTQVLTGLARIHRSMIALGHSYGLTVHAFDPDIVTVANVGRQLFYDTDVTLNKATVLVHRVNCCMGTRFQSHPVAYTGEQARSADFLITCVDTARARREIREAMVNSCPMESYPYWLDTGNRRDSGQVILSRGGEQILPRPIVVTNNREAAQAFANVHRLAPNKPGRPDQCPLPALWEILADIFQPDYVEDNTPSCSLAEALRGQDLFINQTIATAALQLLWTFLSVGQVSIHGYFINLADGSSNPLHVKQIGAEPVTNSRECKAGTNG